MRMSACRCDVWVHVPCQCAMLARARVCVRVATSRAYKRHALTHVRVRAQVLCIAHRLNTIMDYDRVLVMGDGHVLEYDTPAKLLEVSNVP